MQDGGLDQDFYLYTRLFLHKGFLDQLEYDLCRRLYHTLRAGQPPPDLFIWLDAPLEILEDRLIRRGREIDLEGIVTPQDLPLLENYLAAWMAKIPPEKVIKVDSTEVDGGYREALPELIKVIDSK